MSGIPVSAIHAFLDLSSGMARSIFRAAPLSVDVLHAAWGGSSFIVVSWRI